MRKQRTLFFGTSPARTPKKNGENRPVPERRFTALEVLDIRVEFTNTTVTQFGGYPLWASFVEDVGVNAKFAQHIKMNRGENAFTAPELSRFFIDTRVLGAERLVHVDRMRCDPMLVQTYGIDTLASDETLGRYFKAYGVGHQRSLDRMNIWVNRSQWKRARRQGYRAMCEGKVILDYDSMTSTVYGEQEGADRGRSFRKKDNPGFQSKFAFIGGLGIMVNQELCPQSYNLPKDFEAFHKATLAKLPKGARVWAIRSDGALSSEDRIERFEGRGYTYAISAWRTAHLKDVLIGIPEEAWEESKDEEGQPCSIARISYCPATWKKARTYIVSRRLKDLRGQKVMWEWEKYKVLRLRDELPCAAQDAVAVLRRAVQPGELHQGRQAGLLLRRPALPGTLGQPSLPGARPDVLQPGHLVEALPDPGRHQPLDGRDPSRAGVEHLRQPGEESRPVGTLAAHVVALADDL